MNNNFGVAISAIIPVYNTEKYLPACIDSLLEQTMMDFEMIFVDDGSTDRSVEIIRSYQQNDARIKLIQQKNQYAGVARNNGMKIARGKYLLFLDSDDFFEPKMLEEAYRCAEQNQTEITIFGFSTYDTVTGEIKKKSFPDYPEGVFCSTDLGERVFVLYNPSPWNKLFLRSFIEKEKLQFQAIRKGNDIYFTYMAMALAHRAVFCKQNLVFYRINNSNSLQGNVLRDADCFISYSSEIRKSFRERKVDAVIWKSFSNHIKEAVDYYYPIWVADKSYHEHYYEIVKKECIPCFFDSNEEFEPNTIIRDINDSSDFVDFLVRRNNLLSKKIIKVEEHRKTEIERLYDSTVSKESMDYKIGHAALVLPRALMKLIRKK